MLVLSLGLVVFLGIHSVRIVAPAWREGMIARLGEGGWKGVYSIVSAVGLVLIIWGYAMARQDYVGLWDPPVWTRHLALTLMLPVFPLLFAAYIPGRIKVLTRHPMLAAVKVWAFAHLLANGGLHDVVLFGAFLAWAVADRISAKRRPVVPQAGPAPGWGANDAIAVVAGLGVYVGMILFLHAWLFGVAPLG